MGTYLILGGIAGVLPQVSAETSKQIFLGTRRQHSSLHGSTGGADLLAELEDMVGRDHRLATERRVARLEEALQPSFAALPQEGGRIGATSVRYLLHRIFVQRHGWFILGLDAKGEAWNSSSPSEVFESVNTHQHIRSVFDDKLSGKGFDLHHVAVFAATLENLIHTESIERLQATYRLLDFPTTATLSEQEAENVVRTYMMLFVLSLNFSEVSKEEFKAT